MKTFEWLLRQVDAPYTIIQKGTVEANTQDEALRILNEERNIQPHTGELLDIIEPPTLINLGSTEIILK